MNYKFELKEGFRMGELVIRMYENEFGTQLFDPNELNKILTSSDESFETRKRIAMQRLLEQVEGPHIFSEEIQLNGKSQQKYLVDENGLYQILMFINTPESRRMRETFAKILEEYRKLHEFRVSKFLDQCERQTLNIGFHIRRKDESIPTSDYNELKQMEDTIFIHGVSTFPTYNGKVIKDENDEDYINNINDADVESKVDYFIDLDKVIPLFVDVFKMDSKELIEIVFDTVDVYDRSGKFYIDGNKDLMKIIITLLCSKLGEQTEKVKNETFKVLRFVLGKLSSGKEAFKTLFKSSTIYRNIYSDYSYDKQEDYNERYDRLIRRGLGKEEAEQVAKDTIRDGFTHIIVDEDLYGATVKEAYCKIKKIR